MRPEDSDLQTAFDAILGAMTRGQQDLVASWLAKGLLPHFLHPDAVKKYFPLWEQHGFHLTLNHYYSPIPDTRELPQGLWEGESELIGIQMNEEGQLHFLRTVFPQYQHEYGQFSADQCGDPYRFHFGNPAFDGTDALVLYCMVRHFRPSTIVEVGSGYSTLLSASAAALNGQTSLVCIEPYPTDIVNGLPGMSQLIKTRVEDVELDLFKRLGPNDILFIDSTHVGRIGGDVLYLFLQVLPILQPGVVVHVHDIFLPREYPKTWIMNHHLFWNEQYLLQTFLLFNFAFEVLFCNSFMGLRHSAEMKKTFPNSPWWGGASFWMRRKSAA
jgi:hypothetical protein